MEIKRVYFLFGNKIEDEAEAKAKALMYLKGEGNKYNIELFERSLTTEEIYNIIRKDFRSWSTRSIVLAKGWALMHYYSYIADDNRDVEGWDVVKIYKTEAAARNAWKRKTKNCEGMAHLYKVERGFYEYDYDDFA